LSKRNDIKSILIIGAGPIVIGQACEFDYSGAQACKALKEEGYRIILVNSNPATIMTDPNLADATYIEPIQWEMVEKIIAKESPDALLPTMGGQTALNCALDLDKHGILQKYNVELIGATKEAIDMAEDRQLFKEAMNRIGLSSARSAIAHSMEEANQVQASIGYPVIIRPSFTMGGSGGGIAYNKEEFKEICERGLDASPTNELLIEESLLGWKEYEMEVVRDKNDNCIIICSIENLDPMGVHTGDSITVAPSQTLTDKEYQIMRSASIDVLREIGVDTGGSNVQFSINPDDGRMVVIEMNPRVSRSSALASKATGFPIAKIAAKLAVGYTLDELKNDITGGQTPASFEPTIDYVVTKIPRFAFEKFPKADSNLTTQMKSVGEVMAIGRTFQESFQKALRGLETDVNGLTSKTSNKDLIINQLRQPGPDRIWYLADGFRVGMTVDEVYAESKIDRWFLYQIEELIKLEADFKALNLDSLDNDRLRLFKKKGFSDERLAEIKNISQSDIRSLRNKLKVKPIFKRVDTCAAEFETSTAYMYSSYDDECEAAPSNNKKIMILGGGPNRIGQGIEFDYCCVHAAYALKNEGYETIMVNCNPETVSTDYDTSDRLYFEPVTLEDVLEIVNIEDPDGVIVQYGGQTPLKLAKGLESAGVNIIGTKPEDIDAAEDREKFQKILMDLNLNQPPNKTARTSQEAINLAQEIGYPLVVRPSYVLGGRAMEIVHEESDLQRYMTEAVKVSHESPVLLDRFLNDAQEIDVDAISDGKDVVVGGIMQHIEQAGVHSGDSACSLPPFDLSNSIQKDLIKQTKMLAKALKVHGLMNIQFAIQKEKIYILEVNPRASRTVPFVSKAIGKPLAMIAAKVMIGKSLESQNYTKEVQPNFFSVKEAVFPFIKFPGVDTILGPEMKSTGEVMGLGESFAEAFIKSQLGAGSTLPFKGKAFLSVRKEDHENVIDIAQSLAKLGFDLVATDGTAKAIQDSSLEVQRINKVAQGRPHIVDMIKNNEINFIVNITEDKQAIADSYTIRRNALMNKVTYYTTLSGAKAACVGMSFVDELKVNCLQDLHK
jgi:carbamoyl-phosphate synthase large subunit